MNTKKTLLGAAVAGILGVTLAALPARAGEGKKDKKAAADSSAPCYGINKCAGAGACGGENHQCAGENKCKGQGWLKVPKDVCENIQGGSLKPIPKG